MQKMVKVNVFHVGPQKSGTTWLYEALARHPDVCTHSVDSIYYFNMHYRRGPDWYSGHFDYRGEAVVFDPTPSYIRGPYVPGRIAAYNPQAKIMLTARNPLERAFSHYWHEKKKDRFNFTFDEIFSNYDLFCSWAEPGYYASHYRRFLEHFPAEQVKVLFYDDLDADPGRFYHDVCTFCDIDPDHVPETLNTRVNPAVAFKSRCFHKLEQRLSFSPRAVRLIGRLRGLFRGEVMERLDTVDAGLKSDLVDVFRTDIEDLEELTGRNLDHWKRW